MKKVFFMLVLGSVLITSSAFAYSIDEYGRNVWSHDNIYGGHISKHIGKGHNELRKECNGRKINKFITSYPTTSTAEGTLYKMINANRLNREQINQFQNMKGNGVRSNISGIIYKAYSTWWYPWNVKIIYKHAYGQGIDCSRLNEVKTHKFMGWTYYIQKLDEYNYLKKAKANIKFNYQYNKWYVHTSYPIR